jgi:hypothetical protein
MELYDIITNLISLKHQLTHILENDIPGKDIFIKSITNDINKQRIKVAEYIEKEIESRKEIQQTLK